MSNHLTLSKQMHSDSFNCCFFFITYAFTIIYNMYQEHLTFNNLQ